MISDDAVKGNTNPEGFLVFGVFYLKKKTQEYLVMIIRDSLLQVVQII